MLRHLRNSQLKPRKPYVCAINSDLLFGSFATKICLTLQCMWHDFACQCSRASMCYQPFASGHNTDDFLRPSRFHCHSAVTCSFDPDQADSGTINDAFVCGSFKHHFHSDRFLIWVNHNGTRLMNATCVLTFRRRENVRLFEIIDIDRSSVVLTVWNPM